MRGEYSLADIAAATGNGNDGFGTGNGAWWIIVLIALFGWGRGGYGFGSGNGSDGGVMNNYVLNSDFSTLSRQIDSGFATQERKLDSITNGLCDGFYTTAQLVNGLDKSILTTGNTITSQIADVGFGIKDCCCQQLRAIDGVNFNNAQNTTAITNTINSGLQAVMQNCNNNYRSLHDELVNFRIEDKNNQIAALQTQLNNAELRASQEQQSREIINTIRPCPIPAYQSCNPWGCNCNQGCGCNM